MTQQASPLLSRREAAQYLGVEPRTLDVWACTGRYKLKYIKVGRLAKYRKEDLDDFLLRRTINVGEEC